MGKAIAKGNDEHLKKPEMDRLTGELSEVNGLFATIHALALAVIENGNLAPEYAGHAIKNLAMLGSYKVDTVARAMGETGFGDFDDEFTRAA